jgi:ABC-type transporter Mla subunit MlaD
MALQDLTPQLRTRLGRLERLVGLFITLATLLMLSGFGWYVYQTAQRKGWLLTKAPYYTYLQSGAGIKVGDTVKLMGFDAGKITRIEPMPPEDFVNNVYIEFEIMAPNYGYMWSDSTVKVRSAGLLGNRYLEVMKGGTSGSTNRLYATFQEKNGRLAQIYTGKDGVYVEFEAGKRYFLPADEPPELTSQMDQIVQTAKAALPNILALTNQLARVLDNAATATAHLDELLAAARPLVTNLNAISAHLREPQGALGDWLIPTNLNLHLTQTLASANTTLLSANTAVTNTDRHLALLVSNLNLSLENLAGITSNLHAQVDANTNLVTAVNQAIVNADDMVQGLKRHWLLRSAFKTKPTNAPPAELRRPPARPPKWTDMF